MTTEIQSTDPKSGAETFHDRRARRYDDTIRRVIPGYETLHRMASVLLGAAVGDSARLLLVGIGTGAELEVLGPDHPGWRLTACDPAAGMLAVAEERVARLGLGERVSLNACTADALPAEPFDAATCLLVLHFLPDDGAKRAVLESIAARLKPGAPLVLADMYEDPASPRFKALMDAWVAWQKAAGIPAEEVEKGRAHVARDIHFVPETRLDALLAETGFEPAHRFWSSFLFGGYVTWRRGA